MPNATLNRGNFSRDLQFYKWWWLLFKKLIRANETRCLVFKCTVYSNPRAWRSLFISGVYSGIRLSGEGNFEGKIVVIIQAARLMRNKNNKLFHSSKKMEENKWQRTGIQRIRSGNEEQLNNDFSRRSDPFIRNTEEHLKQLEAVYYRTAFEKMLK